MSDIEDHIWILITRNLSGEATPEEKEELGQWLAEDSKHREFYRGIESSWKKNPGRSINAPFLFDYESGLGKLRSKISEDNFFLRKKSLQEKRSYRVQAWRIAASIVFFALCSSVYTTFYFWEEPAPVSYATSAMEQRIITLSDGSVVRLNENSKIEVGDEFAEGTRNLRLEGEAFFDVEENPERPFTIHAGEAVVQVLGTAFNIKEGNEVMVAVKDGLVSFRHRIQNERGTAMLSAGQMGLLSGDGREIKIEQSNVENYMSWMNGYLKFDSMPFDQVVRQLERIYGIGYELQDLSISSLRLTIYTERMQMGEVLETIALAMDLAYERQGDTVIWMHKQEDSMPEKK
ncbi:MAG: FecR domain-containing protein [Balneolaceae bacterium]